MAAIVTSDQYIDYYNNPAGVTQGAIGSALAAGSVVGSLMAGPISDKIGRRDRYAAPFLITGLILEAGHDPVKDGKGVFKVRGVNVARRLTDQGQCYELPSRCAGLIYRQPGRSSGRLSSRYWKRIVRSA